ncbi:MAG: hypothetical protein [Bacteriophage sp.]|nr:MAG: hypothetical protein [Bacteriophage sp.]
MTINATFTTKDQNFNDGTTIYWFEVECESFGVVESECGNREVVDCDGCPSDEYTADQFIITEDMLSY